MAYIVSKTDGIVPLANSSLTAELPLGYAVDDFLVACVCQDVGGTTISTPTGWTQINSQQENTASQAWFYKKVTSTTETDPVFTGRSDEWAWCIFVLRDVDTTTPVHGSNSGGWSGAGLQPSVSLTTTVDDCLILYSWSCDYFDEMRTENPEDFVDISRRTAGPVCQMVGYKQQRTAGAVDVIKMEAERTAEAGSNFTIAFKNASGGNISKDCSRSIQVATLLGKFDTPISTDPSTLITGNLDGISVYSKACVLGTAVFTPYPWRQGTTIDVGGVSTTGQWLGTKFALPATTDFEDKIMSVLWSLTESDTSRHGQKGTAIVLVDGSSNWAAYQLASQANTVKGEIYVSHISVSGVTPYDSSGTVNLAAITDICLLVHRTPTNTGGQTLRVRDLLIKDYGTLVGGSVGDPVSPAFLSQALDGDDMVGHGDLQGGGQGLVTTGIQIGDGTIETHADFTATSFETPKVNHLNQFVENTLPLTIYASANDVMNFTSCVIATTLRNTFTIHASSSTSATYNFTGASFVNWDITWRTGIACNGANITNCDVVQNGGTFTGCNITNTGFTATNLSVITGCIFTSGGSGHAVELTSLGSGTMSWDNTLSGYAASDGSTGDEAIYVNVASGTLTINVASGASTPSIRTAGATVTVASSVPVTITVLDDSTGLPIANTARVAIFNDSTKAEIDSDAVNASGVYSYNYTGATPLNIIGWAREFNLTGTDYVGSEFSGTIDSNGFSLTLRLVPIT